MIDNRQAITDVIQKYFLGTYYGDKEKLREAFHPDVIISGNLQGQLQAWPLDAFIERVTQLPTSAQKGEGYNKEIISMDIENDCAFVKARVVVNGLIFIDFITLLRVDNCWLIRNKSFTVIKL